MKTKQILIYVLFTLGVFLLLVPEQYKMFSYLPIKMETSTIQIIALISLLAAYYYYNGEKFF